MVDTSTLTLLKCPRADWNFSSPSSVMSGIARSEVWTSAQHPRWNQKHPMTASRQKELIEEYLVTLPALSGGCARQTSNEPADLSAQRDARVQVGPSLLLPSLTAVFVHGQASWKPRSLLLDYKGWILTDKEYQNFGYAVHTGVQLPKVFESSDKYVLVGQL